MKTIHLMLAVYLPSGDLHPTEATKISHATQIWYSTPEQQKAELAKAQARLAAWATRIVETFAKEPPNAS